MKGITSAEGCGALISPKGILERESSYRKITQSKTKGVLARKKAEPSAADKQPFDICGMRLHSCEN
jgi:hypothetical protein